MFTIVMLVMLLGMPGNVIVMSDNNIRDICLLPIYGENNTKMRTRDDDSEAHNFAFRNIVT